MMKIRKCAACGSYTLKSSHCDIPTMPAHPARFNPNERYAAQRRKAKGIW